MTRSFLRLLFNALCGFVAVAMATALVASEDECPPGMVKGGYRCEYLNLCADGRPMVNGTCVDTPDVEPQPSPKPTPAPRPTPSPTPPPPKRIPCDTATVFSPVAGSKRRTGVVEREARRVLLVAGKADVLLRRYSKDAATRGIRIDWERTAVSYVGEGGKLVNLKVAELGLGDMLVGKSPYLAVLDAAKVVTAKDLDLADGTQYSTYDIVCGR